MNLLLNSNPNKSLYDLGFDVNVGNVIWNEHKSKLSNSKNDKNCMLIYQHNISNDNVFINNAPISNNEKKGKYIDLDCNVKNTIQSNEKFIILNRGYGTGKYNYKFCLCDNTGGIYYVENHLLIIKINPNNSYDDDAINQKYEMIIKSLGTSQMYEFIRIYVNTGAINVNELLHIFPIFI
jgi:hypothetical protein